MIEFVDVRKSFGASEVLKGITTKIEDGQVVSLIGPSGSGKSTMLRCINGLEKYQSGKVLFRGAEVNVDYRSIHQIRQRLSMVFQKFNLFPHMTALDNVAEGPIHVLGEDPTETRERAEQLLISVGLSDRLHYYPSALSGGQQQRVAICRSLAMHPEAILLDEPTSALDPEMVGEVLSVLRNLAEDGLTMLIVTHEIEFAREVSSHVLVLDDGLLIEQGLSADILRDPRDRRTMNFLKHVTYPDIG